MGKFFVGVCLVVLGIAMAWTGVGIAAIPVGLRLMGKAMFGDDDRSEPSEPPASPPDDAQKQKIASALDALKN